MILIMYTYLPCLKSASNLIICINLPMGHIRTGHIYAHTMLMGLHMCSCNDEYARNAPMVVILSHICLCSVKQSVFLAHIWLEAGPVKGSHTRCSLMHHILKHWNWLSNVLWSCCIKLLQLLNMIFLWWSISYAAQMVPKICKFTGQCIMLQCNCLSNRCKKFLKLPSHSNFF